jgi:hypothetical protein
MLKPATVIFTMPMKEGDPTQITFLWAQRNVQLVKSLGYKVITIEKDATTYDNVTSALRKNSPSVTGRPLVYMHYGHGCAGSLIGNKECIVNREFSFDELNGIRSADPEKFRKLVNPLKGLSCFELDKTNSLNCRLDEDPCAPLCTNPTNVHLLKDAIVFTTACWSAASLGICAEKGGTKSYLGYSEIYMFTYDSKGSQNIFEDIQLAFAKSLLMGKSVEEAEKVMNELEDAYIRKYKKVKFIALPLIWNKLHRKIYGNKNVTIY